MGRPVAHAVVITLVARSVSITAHPFARKSFSLAWVYERSPVIFIQSPSLDIKMKIFCEHYNTAFEKPIANYVKMAAITQLAKDAQAGTAGAYGATSSPPRWKSTAPPYRAPFRSTPSRCRPRWHAAFRPIALQCAQQHAQRGVAEKGGRWRAEALLGAGR